MNQNASRISQAEFEVMKILWRAGAPVSTGDIYQELSKEFGWDRSTVRTLLKRLTEKGVVSAHKLKVLCYQPAISEKEYCDEQIKNVVERLYGGSATRLVTSLVENYDLTDADMEELRDILKVEGEKHE